MFPYLLSLVLHLSALAGGHYLYEMPDLEIKRIIQASQKWDGEEGVHRTTADDLCEALQSPLIPARLRVSGAQIDFFCDHAVEVAIVARAHKLDLWTFMALGTIESRWHPEAKSPKGACGLYQVMPTAETPTCEEMQNNPRKAILAGGRALRSWVDTCKGDYVCGLRKYNGGTKGHIMKDTVKFYKAVTYLSQLYHRASQKDLPET